jgi:hypothetical protein
MVEGLKEYCLISDNTNEGLKSDKKRIDFGNDAAIQIPNKPLETRIKDFKQMLKEKQVLSLLLVYGEQGLLSRYSDSLCAGRSGVLILVG